MITCVWLPTVQLHCRITTLQTVAVYVPITLEEIVIVMINPLTRNEIAHDPPLIPRRVLEYFRLSERTKISQMRSKHRHEIRFQDVVYSKSNKWRAKILKNINKKTSTWCVKLIRKQEIILFLYRATKCPTKGEKIEYEKRN